MVVLRQASACIFLSGLLLASCSSDVSELEHLETRSHAVTFASTPGPEREEHGDPPVNMKALHAERPAPLPVLGDALSPSGEQLIFERPTTNKLTVLLPLSKTNPSGTSTSTSIAGLNLRVQTTPVRRRQDAQETVLSTRGKALDQTTLQVTYQVTSRAKSGSLLATKLALVSNAGVVQDAWEPAGGLAMPPVSCKEQAVIAFGPFPSGMPPVRWPKIDEDCSSSQCVKLALAWLHLHHNAWRASQVMSGLDQMKPAQRSYFWDQPGIHVETSSFFEGETVTVLDARTSPEYWYGAYSEKRYRAVREALSKLWSRVRTNKIGSTNLQLKCPVFPKDLTNVCFLNASVPAHHYTRGRLSFCDEAFGGQSWGGCTGRDVDRIHKHMHHEVFHHMLVDFDGAKLVRDKHRHWHGNNCGLYKGQESFYCETSDSDGYGIRHLSNYKDGGACGHADRAVRTVDAHALYVLNIGNMVLQGEMTHWPKPTPPTQQAPTCVGGKGCLCESVYPGDHAPDGDFSEVQFCPDNGEQLECVSQTFSGAEVGVCRSCEDVRGAGCTCNTNDDCQDDTSCWGGELGTSGVCYSDPPPIFGCLANCEKTMGSNGVCEHDHPGRARCVPYETPPDVILDCWATGGTILPDGDCGKQCGYGILSSEPSAYVSCQQDLHYPTNYVCEDGRCLPDL